MNSTSTLRPKAKLYPKLLALVIDKGIKLYLGDIKVVQTLAGRICLVSKRFGEGYYGTFWEDGSFRPTKICTPEMIATLDKVESEGLAAVAGIGILTGICGICGRTLTDEVSIRNGIGPICADKMGFQLARDVNADSEIEEF